MALERSNPLFFGLGTAAYARKTCRISINKVHDIALIRGGCSSGVEWNGSAERAGPQQRPRSGRARFRACYSRCYKWRWSSGRSRDRCAQHSETKRTTQVPLTPCGPIRLTPFG
jgi:hypothetical protein